MTNIQITKLKIIRKKHCSLNKTYAIITSINYINTRIIAGIWPASFYRITVNDSTTSG